MSIVTLKDAQANSVSLVKLLKEKGASHISLRSDACPFYERPAQGEYYLIDVYMPNGVGGYCYSVTKNGKVSFSVTHYNNSLSFEKGNTKFLESIQTWVDNKTTA
jgi:hypothetical protein